MQPSKYLNLIPLTKFNLWDVKRYTNNLSMSFDNVVRLSDILIPYRKAVSKEELIKNKWQIIAKINFSGELFLRKFEEINSYKGNVNLVPENTIIYSKINVRHGCIYFNELGSTPFAVSNEYPTFKFDETKVDGNFLHILLRSQAFKNLLNSKTTGISKARVKQDEFLDMEIPLPSLDEQNRIVAAYNKKLQLAEEHEQQANKMHYEIDSFLRDELEIRYKTDLVTKNNFQLINFSEVERWDALFLLGNVSNLASKYDLIKFSEAILCFNKLENGKSIRIDSSKFPNNDFRYIGMEHIAKETGILLDMPEVKGKEIKSQTLRVPKDFIIYGKLRPYLNKYWINTTEFDNIICSSEFFVFDIKKTIDKEYFKYVLSSIIIQNQINDKTSGARMPRINEDIFYNLQFPLPPLEKQKEISKKISLMKTQIKELNSLSLKNKQEAIKEFEEEIFK